MLYFFKKLLMKHRDFNIFLLIYLLDSEYCKKPYSVMFVWLGMQSKMRFSYFATAEKILRSERGSAERCVYISCIPFS